jgi:hypothetical protein
MKLFSQHWSQHVSVHIVQHIQKPTVVCSSPGTQVQNEKVKLVI